MNNLRKYIDIVFDNPPGPSSGRFIEVENEHGEGVKVGEWIERPDGYWALRIHRNELNQRDHFAMAALTSMRIDPIIADENDDLTHRAAATAAYRYADAMLKVRKGKPKEEKEEQFVRPDLILAGNSTWKEIQKALDDPRYKTVSVEAGHLEGVYVPVGKSLTLRPRTENA